MKFKFQDRFCELALRDYIAHQNLAKYIAHQNLAKDDFDKINSLSHSTFIITIRGAARLFKVRGGKGFGGGGLPGHKTAALKKKKNPLQSVISWGGLKGGWTPD